MGSEISFTVPIRTNTGMNTREHFGARAARVRKEHEAVALFFPKTTLVPRLPVTVHLTRSAPSRSPPDDDGVVGGLKGVRDAIAKRYGCDDGARDKIQFTYEAKKGPWGVVVRISEGLNGVQPEPELSASDEWSSPDALFQAMHRKYRFTLDGAATPSNAKLPAFISKAQDLLKLNVGKHRVWLNPPYSRGNLLKFTGWAKAQALRGAVVVCLVPAYTCEKWWQRAVHNAENSKLGPYVRTEADTDEDGRIWTSYEWGHLCVRVHFIPGRVHFIEANGATGPARFSSAVVAFEPPGWYPPE